MFPSIWGNSINCNPKRVFCECLVLKILRKVNRGRIGSSKSQPCQRKPTHLNSGRSCHPDHRERRNWMNFFTLERTTFVKFHTEFGNTDLKSWRFSAIWEKRIWRHPPWQILNQKKFFNYFLKPLKRFGLKQGLGIKEHSNDDENPVPSTPVYFFSYHFKVFWPE